MARPRQPLVFFPTYCEVGVVEDLVRRITASLPEATLLVVDDASPDGTGELLDRLSEEYAALRVLHRPHRMGLGSAHKLAVLYARHHGHDALLTLNGDGTHAADQLPRLLSALEDADFVTKGPSRPRISSAERAGTLALGYDIHRHGSLLRAYAAPVIEALDVSSILSDDGSFALESLAAVAEVSTRWATLPVSGAPTSTPLGLGQSLRAGVRLLKGRLRPRPSETRRLDDPVSCRICGATEHVEVHAAREEGPEALADVSPYSCASHSGRTHGQILRCLSCDIVFMRPKITPEALVTEYKDVVDPVYLDNLPARLTTFERTLSHIRPILGQQGRVLEVGSYCGAFLRVAEDHGLDVVGIEPSRWAAEQAKRITSAPVFQGTLDDVPEDLAPFDAVVAWDVVEHFADPVAELRKINELLPMGGRFFFCTLMVDNWFPRIAGSYWPWFMDMHLFYFTEATIRELLRRSGFTLVESTPYRHITTVEYLLRKLGTLGVPGASVASRVASTTPWGKRQIPVRLGDIQLFSCTKVAGARETDDAVGAPVRDARAPETERLLH